MVIISITTQTVLAKILKAIIQERQNIDKVGLNEGCFAQNLAHSLPQKQSSHLAVAPTHQMVLIFKHQ
jgi:hypothetical protein